MFGNEKAKNWFTKPLHCHCANPAKSVGYLLSPGRCHL